MKLTSARSPAQDSMQDSMPKFADPKLREAVVELEQAIGKLNDGEPRPLSDLMSEREEVTLLGAAGGHEKGREKIDARFQRISVGTTWYRFGVASAKAIRRSR